MGRPGSSLVWAGIACVLLAASSSAQQPARTTVSDVVYRADGSAASGTVLISWPAFTTADAKPVAAGTLSIPLGVGGMFSVALAPNAGANPDGTFYKVVLKLDDGTTETETWVIPSSTAAVTIAAVRSTVVPSSVALQVASRQYVDSAVASKAADSGVVHIAGQETISGTKQFATPPGVPAPQQATDAANKAYVDQSVATVGAGSFVAKTGDVMTGPLTLPGEKIDMSGAVYLQHGDTSFSSGSDGVIGGLYAGAVSMANCVAGFRVTPAAGQNVIQALVNGAPTGTALTTLAGHRYVFATRVFASEGYRQGMVFHSSSHPAGSGRGGAVLAANVRVVLEVHDIDPTNPGSLAAPALVLFDGLVGSVPDACTYALINAASVHCSIAFTRILRNSDVLVRSALPGGSFRTRLTGSQIDGAECSISTADALSFFAAYAPAANEQIVAVYRSAGRAVARVQNPASIVALQSGTDDGTRGTVVTAKLPPPRTYADCVNAASAFLDDKAQAGWTGEYDTWSGFLPGGAADVFPGDSLQLNVPSQGAQFGVVVREVLLELADLSSDLAKYKIMFANDAAEPAAFQFEANASGTIPEVTAVAQDVAINLTPDLVAAQITQVSSTTTTIDIGQGIPAGYGVEVRRTDAGWGPDNDRNLVGVFATQGFTVPRLAKRQDYFLRLFDAASPPNYSQHSALLHIDFPY